MNLTTRFDEVDRIDAMLRSCRSLTPLLLFLVTTPLAAQRFPAITDTERTLTEVAAHPGAAAVVLHKHAELRLASSQALTPTTLEVRVRTKILTEAGKGLGQVAVPHSASVRLESFEGQTTTADGRQVALDASAVFTERGSEVGDRFLTKAAFPAVEVGAIIDYRFRLQWRSTYARPFTLEENIPTLLAELVYHVPQGMEATHYVRGGAHYVRGDVAVASSRDETADGTVVRLWAENLPPVLEEPNSLPRVDLVTQVMVLADSETAADGSRTPRFDSWKTVCNSFENVYDSVRAKRHRVKKAALVARGGAKDNARKATLLHAWVRDAITTTGSGLLPETGATLDGVLHAGRGGAAEKALLLQAMLKAIKVETHLVWAIDWRDGFADLLIPNPNRLDRVLVVAEAEGAWIFLDPNDRRLAAGRLAPFHEGAAALVVDRQQPQVIELATSGPENSGRHAAIALAADDDGHFAGRGRLTLTGHHAWFYLRRLEEDAASRRVWKKWLTDHFEGFEIQDVVVDENVSAARIEVAFSLSQHQGDVLGDEASLKPSRPFGPTQQRYTLPGDERRQAVQVSFADRDEVELVLRWSKGWELAAAPEDIDTTSAAGTARATVLRSAAGHQLVYRRTLEIAKTRYDVGEPYRQLRDLYSSIESHDAQSLVLVRE
jgi:hypothetical protein